MKKLLHMIREAGQIALKYHGFSTLDIQIKEDNSPVTEADLAVNTHIVEYLRAHFKDYGILSEELKDDVSRMDKEYVWCLDPIDGTKEFAKGGDDFSILLGLIKNSVPILGIVYQPTADLMLYAEQGKGAFMEYQNGAPQPITTTGDVITTKNATALISRSHCNDALDSMLSNLYLSRTVQMGSVGLKMGAIARGYGELYINNTSGAHEWDTCAPHAILEEAGGIVTDGNGAPLLYNQANVDRKSGIIAASNIALHQSVMDQLPDQFLNT